MSQSNSSKDLNELYLLVIFHLKDFSNYFNALSDQQETRNLEYNRNVRQKLLALENNITKLFDYSRHLLNYGEDTSQGLIQSNKKLTQAHQAINRLQKNNQILQRQNQLLKIRLSVQKEQLEKLSDHNCIDVTFEWSFEFNNLDTLQGGSFFPPQIHQITQAFQQSDIHINNNKQLNDQDCLDPGQLCLSDEDNLNDLQILVHLKNNNAYQFQGGSTEHPKILQFTY